MEVETLRVGRGTDNDVVVNELTVALHHARFHPTPGGVVVEGLESHNLRVNGRWVARAPLRPGDQVGIGGTTLRVRETEADLDLVLEVEATGRRGSDREALRARTHLGLEAGWLTRRRLSWALLAVVAVPFLAVPLLGGPEGAWSSGPLSRDHSFLAGDCQSCHRAGFERIDDAACVGCHVGIGDHADVQRMAASAAGTERCAGCHLEHNGTGALASMGQGLCAECHRDLRADGEAQPASDFGRHHPQFRLSLVARPGSGERRRVRWSREIEERSGLKFSHLRHVGQVVADRASGEKRHLQCGECHVPDRAGANMLPIEFETHCQSCHGLSFDEHLGAREARHGDPVEMRREMRELYAARALAGDGRDASLPAVLRRRVGGALTPPERQAAEAWVARKVREADAFLTEEPGPCATCHSVRPGAAPDGGSAVEPVELASAWLPEARFSHRRHAPFACRECHPAAAVYAPDPETRLPRPDWSLADARPYGLSVAEALRTEHGLEPSRAASDVLIPDLDNCRRCHGGGRARPPHVASDCVLCHGFHREPRG